MLCIMVHKICMCYMYIYFMYYRESAKDFYVHHRLFMFCVDLDLAREIPCYVVVYM